MRRLLALLGMLLAAPALAEPDAVVRVGDHPGFGRVVFDFGSPVTFELAERGNRVLLVFSGAPPIQAPSSLPRNVVSAQTGNGSATLVLAPGARVRPTRMGNRVVVDVLDPPQAGRARPVAVVQPQPVIPQPAALQPAPVAVQPISWHAAAPEPSAVPAPVPVPIPVFAPAPMAGSAATPPASPEPPPALPAALLPGPLVVKAEPGIGAAAFRRGGVGVVVFDGPLPLDAEALRKVAQFTDLDVQVLPAATVLRVPLPLEAALHLLRDPTGWRIAVATTAPPAAVAELAVTPQGLGVKVEQPGRVVAILDPATGQTLLAGTGNPASGAVQRVAMARRTPEYALLPTWLGVVIEPVSDRVDLRVAAGGFTVVAPGASSQAPVADPPSMTRRFDIPSQPVPALVKRLQAQMAGAAATPIRGRTDERKAAALTMIALGLGTEAQALLALTAADDPAAAESADMAGLAGVAALLAGRAAEADSLADPRLDGTDEIELWRGVRDAMAGRMAAATRLLPPRLALAMSYPDALRARVLPIAAEAAVLAGTPLPAAPSEADRPILAFAMALQQERRGETDAALAGYDTLVARGGKADQVRAAVRAADLRFTTGRMPAAAAADILERQAMSWRGDSREAETRLRAVELRTAARAWRAALEGLQQTEALFPELRPDIRLRKGAVFHAMLSSSAPVPPLELVTLAGEFADSIPEGEAGVALASLLADKLAELDLPGRAVPVLQSLMRATAAGPARAGIGLRLAQLRLEMGGPADAEAVLVQSRAAGLPPELEEARALLLARAQAAQGEGAKALAGLAGLGTPAADDLRARLLEEAGDWAGAVAALNELSAKLITGDGPLSERQQDVVLRLASAAVRARDANALRDLGRLGPRVTGARADLFRVLLAQPVREVADLPRSRSEIALARTVPERLQAVARR